MLSRIGRETSAFRRCFLPTRIRAGFFNRVAHDDSIPQRLPFAPAACANTTRGTKAAPSAREHHEHLVLALWPPHPGEPVFELAALQNIGERRGNDPPPETMPLLTALGENRLELPLEALGQMIK